jgi:prevent-host-death family protein
MATRIGTHEAKTRLSEYLNRVSYRGERIIVERHGKPVAALVSMEDLRRLEDLGAPSPEQESEEERQARFRRSMEEAGLVTRWSPGRPRPLTERRPIVVEGPPLSEQIIGDRR